MPIASNARAENRGGPGQPEAVVPTLLGEAASGVLGELSCVLEGAAHGVLRGAVRGDGCAQGGAGRARKGGGSAAAVLDREVGPLTSVELALPGNALGFGLSLAGVSDALGSIARATASATASVSCAQSAAGV
jgi:hypothetical protein